MKKIALLLCATVLTFNCTHVIAKELYHYDPQTTTQKTQVSQVKASHILVETESDAKNLRERIVSGKIDFATAAKKYSKCPSGESGGDLGFFRKGMMVPEFEKAAFSLPVGEVSQPVETQFGWHLIEVTDKK